MSELVLKGVSKKFGEAMVIHSIDLAVPQGQFLALVGPSGCGKSTLLRLIAGLESPTDGDIFLGGRLVNDVSPKGRNVAMVFQNYALYPHMSVRENMSLNLRVAGLPKAEVETRVSHAAQLLGIMDLLDRRPSQLSGGQRQRVAMGRAIVRDPAVFLFDEPLSNLDAKLRVQMRGEIKSLHKKVRTTSIYVTHDQVEAMTLADHVVVMNKGRIEQQGAPLELYQNPSSLFVAGFIGSPAMNFLQATVDMRGGEPWAEVGDDMSLPLPSSFSLTPGASIIIGVRPEHVELSTAPSQLRGTIDYLEPTGAQTQVSLLIGTHPFVAMADGSFSADPDGHVGVNVPADAIHLFDVETGKALPRNKS